MKLSVNCRALCKTSESKKELKCRQIKLCSKANLSISSSNDKSSHRIKRNEDETIFFSLLSWMIWLVIHSWNCPGNFHLASYQNPFHLWFIRDSFINFDGIKKILILIHDWITNSPTEKSNKLNKNNPQMSLWSLNIFRLLFITSFINLF